MENCGLTDYRLLTTGYCLFARRMNMTGNPKISIVGAGNVGASCAAAAAARQLGDVYLYDVVEDLAAGKAMDINHAGVFFHSDSQVRGCNTFNELAGSDIVVITAGHPRHAGMKRKDLLQGNLDAMSQIASDLKRFCPRAVVLVVTNPVEILTQFVKEQCPQMPVMGLGCTLDTVRLKYFLAAEADVSVDSVNGIVIGSHNDNMIPLIHQATIGGMEVERVLTAEHLTRAIKNTRQAGADIVSKLRTRGSFYAASHCVAEIIDSIVRDRHAVFPLSVPCNGQYGYHDTCLALPCSVGLNGVESVIEIKLDDKQRQALDICASEIMACSL